MEKSILTQFLKAGFIYKRHLNPTKAGTPQGGTISPILANMTLDGIEKLLLAEYPKRSKNSTKCIRFSDFRVTLLCIHLPCGLWSLSKFWKQLQAHKALISAIKDTPFSLSFSFHLPHFTSS